MVVGKSPLTDGWGETNSGGFLSQEIKRTGFDAVFFAGASETPVWVDISDEMVEIKDASSLWGKDIVRTGVQIKAELCGKKVRVASIGEIGEKLSLISGISTDCGHIAARSGLGALMGSKKLKAVAFRGKQKIPVARPDVIKTINSDANVIKYQKKICLSELPPGMWRHH